jgi:hypothetical protein
MKGIKELLKERRYKNRNRIIKQLSKRVKFQKIIHDGKEQYRVFKKTNDGEWEQTLSTTKLSKAIHYKHNLWMIGIRDLGYRPFLIERRKKRLK